MPSVGAKRKYGASMSSAKRSRFARRRSLVTIPRGITGGTRVSYGSIVRSGYTDLSILQGTGVGHGMSFTSAGFYVDGTLANFNGGTDIGNAFDAYRIKAAYLHFVFNQNQSAVAVTSTTLPYLYVANDYDDVTTLSLADVLQRDGVKQFQLCGDVCKWKVVPKVAAAAYGTTAVSAYMEPKAMQWVSTGAISGLTDAQHYGTKFYVDATKMTGTGASIGNLRVFVTVYYDLKHAQ